MSRLGNELRLIPIPARVISGIVLVTAYTLMYRFPLQMDPELRHWPEAGKLAFALLPGLPLAVLALMVGYVYADARRRGMRYVMWTFLAALVPNAIGIILYFILRDPLMVPCPGCAVPLKHGYAFCPKCGAPIFQACPQCRRAVESGWSHCVSCGTALPARVSEPRPVT